MPATLQEWIENIRRRFSPLNLTISHTRATLQHYLSGSDLTRAIYHLNEIQAVVDARCEAQIAEKTKELEE